jgi:hypothetical protein
MARSVALVMFVILLSQVVGALLQPQQIGVSGERCVKEGAHQDAQATLFVFMPNVIRLFM